MSQNRYKRILTFDKIQYQPDCPIMFQKGALLFDNVTQKNLLQLRFSNISKLNICAVYVSIKCHDLENNHTETFENKSNEELSNNYYFNDELPPL